MELYESRVASLQRFVAMCVMFHQTGKQVQDFFPKYSFGLMSYNMERTHSIMRIATTASPVSGDAVRGQMERLRLRARYLGAVHKIESAWSHANLTLMRNLKREFHASSAVAFNQSRSGMDISGRSQHGNNESKRSLLQSKRSSSELVQDQSGQHGHVRKLSNSEFSC